MGFRFNCVVVSMSLLILSQVLFGCISFQYVQRTDGTDIRFPEGKLFIGKTSLAEVLSLLGAPDELATIEGGDMLLYKRAVSRQSEVSFGIPVFDITGARIDLSTYGTFVCYDTKTLIFSPDRILQQMVFDKCVDHPYWKTIFSGK